MLWNIFVIGRVVDYKSWANLVFALGLNTLANQCLRANTRFAPTRDEITTNVSDALEALIEGYQDLEKSV
ncbi:hypothetical protein MHK_007786 [Candidatus Magnetomorum sp. HK-1]|nr:hypothetical protein MHK_007786 [Candidatus Magnetomorum sp. HK-1]